MRRIALIPLCALVAGLLALGASAAEALTQLDPAYGDEGVATFMVPNSYDGELRPAAGFFGAMDSQGRALVSDFDDQIVRLTADGDPDLSFGPSGAAGVPLAIGGGPIDASHGAVVVAGEVDDHVAVLRLHDNGTPDDAFGEEGVAISELAMDQYDLHQPFDVEVGADGAVYVLSQVTDDGVRHIHLQRFASDGSTDENFGDEGVVLRTATYPLVSDGMAVDQTGIVLLENRSTSEGLADDTIDVMRLTIGGDLDPSFGSAGSVHIVGAGALVVKIDQQDGSIVVGGADLQSPKVWRLHADGRFDARFGEGAILETDGLIVWDLALLDEGRVAALVEGSDGASVALLDPDGNLTSDFGSAGVLDLPGLSQLNTGGIGQGTNGRLLVVAREDQTTTARAFLTDLPDLAPEITDVTPYETSLSVEWTAPEAVGEHPIRIYHLVALQDGELAGQSVVAGDVRQASIEGLDPLDEAYEIVILPYDDFGPYIASAPFAVAAVESAPPAGTAPAVPGVEVDAGRGSATVSWDPLQDDGGSTIWGYIVVAVRKTDGVPVKSRTVRADVRTMALTELANSTAYDVYVVAVTSEGYGALGTPVVVTPSAAAPAPAAPEMSWVSVVPTGAHAVVTWGPATERGEVTSAVHVIVIDDGVMTHWKPMTGFDRQVVVPAAPGAQIYVVAQSPSGFGPLTGPVAAS